MTTIEIILIIYLEINFLLYPFLSGPGFSPIDLSWLSPMWLHKHKKINFFGAFFLALLANIIFLPWAVAYWLHILCTTDRK